MNYPIYLVDAFASERFRGNPAAVCLLESEQSELWMQQVAMEMNQAETAFVLSEADGYNLRWFTPTIEVDLCGHATIGSAHVLWEAGLCAPESEIVFYTKSGKLNATRSGEWIVLDFPSEPPVECEPPPGLLRALGVPSEAALFIGRNRMDYFVRLQDDNAVLNLEPDVTALGKIECRGVIVTSLAERTEHDFVSRFFAPASGIPEDPVTGSAHCCLGPFWAEVIGDEELVGYQASKRGGLVRVQVASDRVLISGKAITTLRGELSA